MHVAENQNCFLKYTPIRNGSPQLEVSVADVELRQHFFVALLQTADCLGICGERQKILAGLKCSSDFVND